MRGGIAMPERLETFGGGRELWTWVDGAFLRDVHFIHYRSKLSEVMLASMSGRLRCASRRMAI